jgi:hypothetical protein
MGHLHVVCVKGHQGLIGFNGFPGEVCKLELVFTVQSATTPKLTTKDKSEVAELHRMLDLQPPPDAKKMSE